jgi:hypothetical protein
MYPNKRYKKSISLPTDIVNYIWEFCDLDTRIKNKIKPRKLNINFTLKIPTRNINVYYNHFFIDISPCYALCYIQELRESVLYYYKGDQVDIFWFNKNSILEGYLFLGIPLLLNY